MKSAYWKDILDGCKTIGGSILERVKGSHRKPGMDFSRVCLRDYEVEKEGRF